MFLNAALLPPIKIKMAHCTHCKRPMTLPPTIHFLLTTYPKICPTYSFPRHKPRCKHCDQVAANAKAIDAELSGPDHTNPVTKLENQISQARRLVWDGIRVQELEEVLPKMEERLREARKKRDEGVKKAWDEFRGVWGPEY